MKFHATCYQVIIGILSVSMNYVHFLWVSGIYFTLRVGKWYGSSDLDKERSATSGMSSKKMSEKVMGRLKE